MNRACIKYLTLLQEYTYNNNVMSNLPDILFRPKRIIVGIVYRLLDRIHFTDNSKY